VDSTVPADLLKLLRHEVASITVKTARVGLHPLFHQRFSTGMNKDDCQPQGGRGLETDRMVKISEPPHTRRYVRSSVRGCHAVTKRYVAGMQAEFSCIVDNRVTGV